MSAILELAYGLSTIRLASREEETMTITSATLQRTFRVRCGNECGTCFTIDVDGKRYLVTAKHLAHGVEGRGGVEIWRDGAWNHLSVELVGHRKDDDQLSFRHHAAIH